MNRTGTAQWANRHSSTTRRGAGPMLVHPVALRSRDLPSLPVDEVAPPSRLSGWERRLQRSQSVQQLKTGLALGFGGVLGTAIGTALCLALGS